MLFFRRKYLYLCLLLFLTSCTTVGPDFVKPDVELPNKWSQLGHVKDQGEKPQASMKHVQWWKVFQDPVLDRLLKTAWQQNNSLEIAGLRVLEARAQLGVAQGTVFPQTQAAAGSANHTSSRGGKVSLNKFGLGLSTAWEMDFWGRFKRGIESADAAFLASIEGRNQVFLLLTAQVVDTYLVIRINEELLRVAHENEVLQQRSYDIAGVLFRNGSTSELDVQQAKTLLLTTQSAIPGYEVSIKKGYHALSALLGKPPGAVNAAYLGNQAMPLLPTNVYAAISADILRQRPDVRQAELAAMAQNALVGLAEADLYPSFSLSGSLGLAASSAAGLFAGDALTYSIGTSFVWPFLNYGRIRNNVRVQDARLQQALIQYREVVIQAAREAESAMVSLQGSKDQAEILVQAVASAQRSNTLSLLRYKEGLSDYQRVLDSQRALFNQQKNLIGTRGASVRHLVALYKALGGGWDAHGKSLISNQSRKQMSERTDWDDLMGGQEIEPKR